MKLTNEERDLLRWSGELEGEIPAGVRNELEELSRSVRRLPQHAAPSGALSAALARNEQAGLSSRRPVLRLILYTAAAAIVVFAVASLLLSDPARPVETVAPTAADTLRPASAFPARIFPKAETSNLKRIRDARARILRIKQRKARNFSRDQGVHPASLPTVS